MHKIKFILRIVKLFGILEVENNKKTHITSEMIFITKYINTIFYSICTVRHMDGSLLSKNPASYSWCL